MIAGILTLVVLVTTLLSCMSDVRALRIPNAHVLVILAAFIAAFILSPQFFGPWWAHLGAMALFLVLTYVMFALGMLGAGDAKFGSALALWVGLPGLMLYVIYMALAGGVIGILSLVLRKYRPVAAPRAGGWVATVQDGGNAVPYGIAITFGAWASLFHTGFMFHILDEVNKAIH